MSVPQKKTSDGPKAEAFLHFANSMGIQVTTSTVTAPSANGKAKNSRTNTVTTASNTEEGSSVWSNQKGGGNVLHWLSQKTQSAPASKGAVEYLNKIKQPNVPVSAAFSGSEANSTTDPIKSPDFDSPTQPTAGATHGPISPQEVFSAVEQGGPSSTGKSSAAVSHVDPKLHVPTGSKTISLHELEQKLLSEKKRDEKKGTSALTTPNTSSDPSGEKLLASLLAGPATVDKQPTARKEVRGGSAAAAHAGKEAEGVAGRNRKREEAAKEDPLSLPGNVASPPSPPSYKATDDGEYLSPPLPKTASGQGTGFNRGESGKGQGVHRVRGRRNRDGADLVAKRRNEAIALRRHQEALLHDPEYQQRFQTAQEIQRNMVEAQAAFMEKYRQQETVVNLDQSMEKLDIPVILDLIEQHDVVFICTDTGTGKSTNVPRALLEMSPHTRVVSTQPRRTATIAIATRVASMRHENVGEDVGYWIRGEKKGDDDTRLWYMTSYTLLLRLLENPSEIPYTHIMLDEFHERQPDLEVMVAMLRLALMQQSGKLKLIIMSATLNTENWEEYFSGLRVATYKQSEPAHPIHDFFLEDTCKLLGHDYTSPSRLLERLTVDKKIVDNQMYIAENLIVFLNYCSSSPAHSILVFLPGRAQVEQMQIAVDQRLRNRADVIAWHSAVDLATIGSAMRRRGGASSRQKIYLATDIAEVSITLPDVVFVVDTALVKRPQIRKDVPSTILYPPLLMKWISKGSLAQRRGRVGRVQQGFYFSLFPSQQVQDLPDYSEPPIENSRIDELSLHCLEVVSNPAAIYSICRGQPLMESISSSMNTLIQLGCILDQRDPCATKEWIPGLCDKNAYWNSLIVSSAKKEIKGEIVEFQCTFLGRLLQLIPVSPQQGLLVFYGFLTGLESLMILAAAVTSSLSPFTFAGQEGGKGKKRMPLARAMEETENVLRDMCCGLRSDVIAVMKATLLFRIEEERHGFGSATVHAWCTQKNLSYEKLSAITDLENHIKYELAEFLPFRDIVNLTEVLEQLEKMAAPVIVMLNAAFVSQAVEVMSEGMTYNTMETAVGIFSDLFAVPDIHSPSCFRWLEGDLIIPVQLSLSFDKLLASFSTAIKTYKQFWVSLLLLSYRINYATFSDDDGTFHVFCVEYGKKKRFVEMDEEGGCAVIAFRRQLSQICQNLHITHLFKNVDEENAVETLIMKKMMEKHNIRPLVELQREVITSLVNFFAELDSYVADEVEHAEDDLDVISIFEFGLSPLS